MQDQQLRWMIGLSVLVLLLVAALSFGESDGPEDRDPEATVAVLVLPDINEVVRIERTIEDEVLSLVRVDDGWEMESPYAGTADSAAADRLLDDLREMARGVPLDPEGADLAEYGLGDPRLVRIRVRLSDGTDQEATFGDPAPVGWRTYALAPGGGIVAVGGRSELLTEPSSAFRDHRVYRFDPARVRAVRITRDDHVLDVSGQGRRWWLDGFTRADPNRVDDLVMGLLNLRFDRVMDLGTVSDPLATVQVELDDGTVRELRVGERTPMGNLVESPHGTGMVFPESLALLGMGPTDIGDRQAVPVSLDRDTRVVIAVEDRVWEATRAEMAWRSADRDDAATAKRVDALARVGIAYRLEPVPEPESVFATIEVFRREERVAVELGPAVDGFHHARDLDGGAPYRVRESELAGVLEVAR